jgi:alkylation response protein AidB-like acyl-CoA dehydrogenase
VFDAVPVAEADLLAVADGLELFADHFTHYRSLVTATALGAASSAHDMVSAHLTARCDSGEIDRVRDHAIIAVGRTHAQINSALLAACIPSGWRPMTTPLRRCGAATPRPTESTWPEAPPTS